MAKEAAKLLLPTEQRNKDALASKIVDFVYSTNNRNSLGLWMKSRVNRGEIIAKKRGWGETTLIGKEFEDFLRFVSNAHKEDVVFNKLVNLAFPCWTGTMTCYIE
ncbi:MAG: hypothetical protein LBF54_00140 [Holosporaceae bacterium]|jgi:hypothetical protein|nr:hypothetical protein [Holosporaceae bacterium]